ncbi:hypothetical protein BH09BAC5_BH09BAC5_28840 [soil metagenome]
MSIKTFFMKFRFTSTFFFVSIAFALMSFIIKGEDYPKMKVGKMDHVGYEFENLVVDTANGDLYASVKENGEKNKSTIVRWNGKDWEKVGNSIDYFVTSLCFFDENLYVGVTTTYQSANGAGVEKNRGGVVYVLSKGYWKTVGENFAGDVNELIVFKNELYAAGNYIVDFGKDKHNSILCRLVDNHWEDCKTTNPVSAEFHANCKVRSACIYDDNIVIAGAFDIETANGRAKNLVMWDGNKWSSPDFKIPGARYTSLAVFKNELIVAGDFLVTSKPYQSINCIYSWDGAQIKSLQQGLLSGVDALEVFNQKLYVGGRFYEESTTEAKWLAMWDGTDWHKVVDNMKIRLKGEKIIRQMISFNQKLIIAGCFLSINKIETGGIASLTISE